MAKRIAIVMSGLILMGIACSSISTVDDSISPTPRWQWPTGESQQDAPGSGESQPDAPGGGDSQETGERPSQPVSIRDGLASLNSYVMRLTFSGKGPDPNTSSTLTMEMQRSQDQDARFTRYSSTSTDEQGETDETDSDLYRIGNDECTGSDGDWTWTSMTPNEAEMRDLIQEMLTVSPLIDNPSFVAEETINGIPSNHFVFKVSGLGVKSGAEVTANQGEYWLAIDGRYIVKYTLVVETRSGPSTDVIREEIYIELTSINQPVSIEFPQGCWDARE